MFAVDTCSVAPKYLAGPPPSLGEREDGKHPADGWIYNCKRTLLEQDSMIVRIGKLPYIPPRIVCNLLS